MSTKEELEFVKKWRGASMAGALPFGGITMFMCYKKVNQKFPVAGDKMRGRAIAGSVMFSMVMSGSMYGISWVQGMQADADRLAKDSKLRKWLRPDEVIEGIEGYPSKEEAAISLGYKPEFADSDIRVTGIAADQVKLGYGKGDDHGMGFKKE